MEGKNTESDNKDRVEPVAEELNEKIECDEVLSGSESAEMTEEKTDSSDRGTGTDEKSPMPSDSTSGIETKSESIRSPEQTLSAAMDAKCPPVSAVQGAVSDTADKMSAVKGAVKDSADPVLPADTPAEKTEVGSEISPPEKSKKRGSLVRGAMAIFKKSPHKKDSSPNEKTGMLSRFKLSKSVASPEKPPETAEESREREREAACATPEDEAFKKGTEKQPVLKRLAKSLSSVFKHKSGSGGETEGLVTDQDEPQRTPVTGSPVKAKDEIMPEEGEIIKRIYWTEGRQSLTQRPSLSLTERTDLPSTFTGEDVFLPGDSRRPSEVGENTSEEAVAGSLASSLGDIKEIASDKDEKSASSISPANEVELNIETPTESETEDISEAAVKESKVVSEKNKEVEKGPEANDSANEDAKADVEKGPEANDGANEDAKADVEKGSEPTKTEEILESDLQKPSESSVPDVKTSVLETATEIEQPANVDKTE